MLLFESVFMAEIWNNILQRFNKVSIALQKENMELGIAMKLLKSLQVYVVSQRGNFDQFEQKAHDKAPQVPYKDANKRQVHRKRQGNDGPAEERVLTGRDRFRLQTFLPILDKLSQA